MNIKWFPESPASAPSESQQVLDPLSGQWDQWFTKPPMGVKRTMHAAAVAGGRPDLDPWVDQKLHVHVHISWFPKTHLNHFVGLHTS